MCPKVSKSERPTLGGASLKLPGRDNVGIMSGRPGLRTACQHIPELGTKA